MNFRIEWDRFRPGLGFLVLGILALGGGTWFYLDKQNINKNGIHTQGTIVGFDDQWDSKNNKKSYPIFQYADQKDKVHVKTSPVHTNPPIGVVGDKVEVAYPDGKPEEARILMGLWDLVLPGLFWFFGLGLGMIGVISIKSSILKKTTS